LVERRADPFSSETHVDRIADPLKMQIAAVCKTVRYTEESQHGIDAEVNLDDQTVALCLEERSLHKGN
jgi:hypothetical protein